MNDMTYEHIFRKMGYKQDVKQLSEADAFRRMERAHTMFTNNCYPNKSSDLYNELNQKVYQAANRLSTALIDYINKYSTPEEIKNKLKGAIYLLSDPTYEKVIEACEICRDTLMNVDMP